MSSPPNQFPPDVLDALVQGKPLEAIKRLRRAGLGLAEAKAALEAYRDGLVQSPSLPPQSHTGHTFKDEGRVLPAEVLEALQRGDKIGAIRLLRERTGLGLKEAKHRVEAAGVTRGAAHADRAPSHAQAVVYRSGLGTGEVRTSNAALWVVLGLLAVLVAYYMV